MTTQPDTGATAPAAGWRIIVMILAAAPVILLAISGISSVLPKMETALAHGPEDALLIKMLVGVVTAAMVVGAPLSGFLIDRVGLRKVMFIDYLVFTIAGFAGMFVGNLYLLIGLRFLLGLAAAGAGVTGIILINNWMAPERRAFWMGTSISAAMICAIIVNPISGALGEMNWRYVFFIYLFGAPFAVIAATFPDDRPTASATAGQSSGAGDGPILSWFPLGLGFLAFAAGAVVYLPMIYTPFRLRDLGIDSPKLIAFVLMASTITAAVAGLVYGRMRTRLSEAGAFIASFASAGVGLLIAGLAGQYKIVMVGMAVYGLSLAWFIPTLLLAVGNRVAAHQQGRAVGITKAVNYLGPPLGVLAMEPLARAHGPQAVILAASLLSLVLVGVIALQAMLRGRSAAPALQS